MFNTINQEKIDTVIRAFTGKEVLNLNPLLTQWVENKKDIFELFNNSLTIEKEFSGSLSDEAVLSLFRNFRNDNDYVDYNVREFMSELTAEEIKNNKCIEDRDDDEYENYKKGQKLSKYLNNLIHDRNDFAEVNGKHKTKREYFSIQLSMFLQSLKFDGVIVVSIDPLDYLTMSLNKNNWQSCHGPEGCYQAGMLSYMTDSCSVIAYVKSVNDVEYDINGIKFTHNSKKWRQVSYIDINTLSAIFSRQYPADNENASKVARELIATQFSQFIGIQNKHTITRNRRRIFEMIKDHNENPFHYNDIIRSERNCTRLKMVEGGENPHIVVGNTPYCPACGEKHLDKSNTLLCNRCREDYRICAGCGERIYLNEGVEVHSYDGEVYCDSCFNERFVLCEECHCWEPRERGMVLEGKFVCNSCIRRNYSKCNDCGTYIRDNLILEYQDRGYCVTCYDRIAIEEEVSA